MASQYNVEEETLGDEVIVMMTAPKNSSGEKVKDSRSGKNVIYLDEDIEIIEDDEPIGTQVDKAIAEVLGKETVVASAHAPEAMATTSPITSETVVDSSKKRPNARKRRQEELANLH